MLKSIYKLLAITVLMTTLSSCGFFDKDNTPVPSPLVAFTPSTHPRLLWSAHTRSDAADQSLKLTPAIGLEDIYTSNLNGTVSAINKTTGRLHWQTNTNMGLNTGPAYGNGVIAVGGRRGELTALRASDGRILWHRTLEGGILATPAITTDRVVVKTINGYVRALAIQDGHELWSFQQVEPALILRGASTPVIHDRSVVVGFASGNLYKLNLHNGEIDWEQMIAQPEGAFAIQRMIDIDANPILHGHHIYAATYQGKIAGVSWADGHLTWTHDLSSYTGMVADNDTIYVTDAYGYVWAFNADNGEVKWRQTKLTARVLTAPTQMDRYVVVADAQGYLHWLNKTDGRFAARVKLGAPTLATPLVENGRLYIFTSKGTLLAYQLS